MTLPFRFDEENDQLDGFFPQDGFPQDGIPQGGIPQDTSFSTATGTTQGLTQNKETLDAIRGLSACGGFSDTLPNRGCPQGTTCTDVPNDLGIVVYKVCAPPGTDIPTPSAPTCGPGQGACPSGQTCRVVSNPFDDGLLASDRPLLYGCVSNQLSVGECGADNNLRFGNCPDGFICANVTIPEINGNLGSIRPYYTCLQQAVPINQCGGSRFGACPEGYGCINSTQGTGQVNYVCAEGLRVQTCPPDGTFIQCIGTTGEYHTGVAEAEQDPLSSGISDPVVCRTRQVQNDARCIQVTTPTPVPTPTIVTPTPTPTLPTPTPTPAPTWRNCIDGELTVGTPPSEYRATTYPGAGGGLCWEPRVRVGFEPSLEKTLQFFYRRGTSQYPSPTTIKVTNPSYASSYRITFTTNPDIIVTPKTFTLSPRSTESVIVNVTPILYDKLGDGVSTIGMDVDIVEI